MNEVLNTIANRKSHRAYKDAPLTQQQIDTLLQAAVQSPSAMNLQPWHFSIVTDQKLLQEMNVEMHKVSELNIATRSPRFADPNFHVFYHAPLVIFISADPENSYSYIDSGIAVENIALAAESMGLGSVILGLPRMAFSGEKAEEFKKALNFPENYQFIIAISIGTPNDDKEAHPIHQDRISFIR